MNEAGLPDKKFEYRNPAETEDGAHEIELNVDGKYVGFANLVYSSNPFPFYSLSLLFVNEEDRGKRFGNDILKEVMSWLDEKKRPAILINAIEPDNPARSMYEKSGWKPIQGKENWLGYNLPLDLDKGRINKALYAIRKTETNRIKEN